MTVIVIVIVTVIVIVIVMAMLMMVVMVIAVVTVQLIHSSLIPEGSTSCVLEGAAQPRAGDATGALC